MASSVLFVPYYNQGNRSTQRLFDLKAADAVYLIRQASIMKYFESVDSESISRPSMADQNLPFLMIL